MNKSILNQFRLTVMENQLNVLGINLYINGKELEHRFFGSYPVNIYSASKTFTSIGVGIAVDEGLFNLNDTVAGFFPEYSAGAATGHELVTVRDLLHMACGINTSKALGPSVLTREVDGKDYLENYFASPVLNKAGSTFTYDNMNTYILARIVSKVTGQHFTKYLQPRLFDKINIQYASWANCPSGHCLAASGLHLTTEELHRLGKLMLFKGVYNDKRVVSEQYIKSMNDDYIDNSTDNWDENGNKGYGYQVWRCNKEGVFRADGMLGQISVVDPSLNAVVTVTSYEECKTSLISKAMVDDILCCI